MKKLILSCAFLAQTALSFATGNQVPENPSNDKLIITARYENVKMHRQPGTSTAILKALYHTDDVKFVRKYNLSWSIIIVDGQVGYVLTSELGQAKNNTKIAIAKK